MGIMQLAEQALSEIESISAEDAVARKDSGELVFVDVRDIREVEKSDTISGSHHAPRGMIEFWFDQESPYYRDIYGEKDKTYVFDVRAYALVSKYARNNQKTASIAWSKSGRHLYVGHDDGALITWDIFSSGENKMYASKSEAHLVRHPDGRPDTTSSRVQELSVNHDGVLASCGFDGCVNLWTASDGTGGKVRDERNTGAKAWICG